MARIRRIRQQQERRKSRGPVVLSTTIGKDGVPHNIQVQKSPDKLLSDSSIKAFRTWRYKPYLLNGRPVAVDTTVNITYNLGG